MNSDFSKRWEIAEKINPMPPEVDQELEKCPDKFPPFFRKILYSRGVTTSAQAVSYLEGGDQCDDPFDLMGMKDTVRRLEWAIKKGEKVVVYGDYDVDGVTATALMVQVLERLGAQVSPYIPNRFDEGYGVNIEAVEKLAKEGTRLVITVDCGIRSVAEAQLAEDLGMDMLITDHHHPQVEIPPALAVVCPRQPGDTYPFKELSGVGLAYKVAQALISSLPPDGVDAREWLDLVALGTVADIVSLTGENRQLVRQGLDRIHQGKRPGISALVGAARIPSITQVNSVDIGFKLAPRLNAAGRLDTATKALKLLLANTLSEAGLIAQELDDQNNRRQDMTHKMQEDADRMARADECEQILFAFDPQFNEGVVGLAASRLAEKYYRPAIVGKNEGEFTRASCRSIREFHITQALDECKDLLERHGGHAMAAGFTVRTSRLEELKACLKQIAARELDSKDLRPILRADVEIPLAKFGSSQYASMMNWLAKLQPTGQDNPEAVFVSRGLTIVKKMTMGKERQHLKIFVTDGKQKFEAVAFNKGHLYAALPDVIDLMYSLEWNEFNGLKSIQLKVKDIKPANTPDE